MEFKPKHSDSGVHTLSHNIILCLSKLLILKLKRLKPTLHQHKGNKGIRYHSSYMNRDDSRSTDEVVEFTLGTLTSVPSLILPPLLAFPYFFHRHQASLASLKTVKDQISITIYLNKW